MKTYSLTNFTSLWDDLFLAVTGNKFKVWNYNFSSPTGICLFEFSSVNSGIKSKVCSKLNIEAPGVVLVFLLSTLLLACCLNVFLLTLNMWMPDGILYCLNLNLSIRFRVGYRGPATLNAKHCNNSQQQFSATTNFFCHRELHLRGCVGLEVNIVTWYAKILKGIGGTLPMIELNLGKIWKTHSPNVFRIKFFAFNKKWTKWNYINSLTYAGCGFKSVSAVYLAKAYNHLISSNAT